MREVSSLICADETGTGELPSPVLLSVLSLLGQKVLICPTSPQLWHVAVLCHSRVTDGPLGLLVPEGRFDLGFSLRRSSSRSRAWQSMAAWPVLPQWEHTSFCALTKVVDHLPCVQRGQVLSVRVCQFVNTHARAHNILVADVLHDHAPDLRAFAFK